VDTIVRRVRHDFEAVDTAVLFEHEVLVLDALHEELGRIVETVFVSDVGLHFESDVWVVAMYTMTHDTSDRPRTECEVVHRVVVRLNEMSASVTTIAVVVVTVVLIVSVGVVHVLAVEARTARTAGAGVLVDT
jgi:hypothetical protein